MARRKGGIDRLSGLPDEILYHILSFLSTKRSVCTSVLSKRWRFLWKHVPTLEFIGHNFTGRKKKHLDIINRIIMLHEAKIVNTFRLYYVKGPPYRFETLLIYPIMRGVRNLFLDFDFRPGCDIACTLPRLLLTCKTLVDLKLTNCGVFPSSGELFWPSLKKLHLSYVEYEDDESLPHLLSGCPVLEELTIRDCFGKEEHYSGSVIISSPTIKKLNVDFSHGGAYFPEKMLLIDVPAVTHLLVVSYDLECVKSLSKTMTSLIEAEITLVGDDYMCGFDCTEHGRSIEFLSSLCHVRYLKISAASDEMSFDMVGTGSMPEFENLTKLELDWTVNWRHLVKFLEVADNLEVLFVRDCLYKEPKQVPPCMLSRLRTVRMHYFSACEDAFDMVKFILRNARVLEAMEFFHVASDEENLIARERISLFERVSKTCQLAFNTDEIVKFMLDKIRPKQILVFEPPF